MTDTISSKLEEFREYVKNNISKEIESVKEQPNGRDAFIEEYPLGKLKDMSVDEYCMGTDVSKDSLCYMLEFGKYSGIPFGIGGGSAWKFGVYFSKKDDCYSHRSELVEDIDDFWPEFRSQLYQFLKESGNSSSPVALEDYPLLQGMAMVLTKLLCFYYPDKYMSIGSATVVKELMDCFQYHYTGEMKVHQLNHGLLSGLKKDIPELRETDGIIIGNLAWKYHGSKQAGTRKGAGLGNEDIEETHYWMYSPGNNASKWDEYSVNGIMGIGWGQLGDLTGYKNKAELQTKLQELTGSNGSFKNDSLAAWQFVKEMKPGDIVYAKRGTHTIIGRGVVRSEYIYDPDVQDGFNHLREIDWNDVGEWPHPGKAVQKTLTDITAYTDYVERLEELFIDTENEYPPEIEKTWPKYSREDFLRDVFMDEADYDSLVGLIKNKKNVILQGAPGVGKTYAANRLAYSMIGRKDLDRVMLVQFHQSYSYEDFIEGYRPSMEGDGFEIKKGSFYSFCKKATEDIDNDYFFIIDEINRGNLSKIFGELFMLIEKDKRGNSLQLLYSDEKFFVPQNVYIIGMMNTADRSLALLDYALRRRFAFYDMKPAFAQEKFIQYRIDLDSTKLNKLIDSVTKLNEAITDDSSLGEGFCIGHSYFCDIQEVTDAVLNSIVEYELIPLIREYWYDEQDAVRDWSEKLRSAIK